MRSTSVLLAICIITITLSCFVSFTQAEGLRYRYTQYKVARADTPKNETGGTGLTTGGSYTGGSNSTTGGGLTTGAISGNSTSNSTGSSGELTSGGGTTGAGTTSSVSSSTTGKVTTSGGTTSATEQVVITFVITYKVRVDRATFNYTAAEEQLKIEFKITITSTKLTVELREIKRAVQAVGDYELVVTIVAIQGEDPIAETSEAQMEQAANGAGVMTALSSAGVVNVTSVGVERTQKIVTVTTTGSGSGSGSTTAGGPDASSGGLSAGAIAGIVIAIVAVVAIVVVIVIVSKKRAKKHSQVQPLLNNHNNGGHYP